MAIDKKTCLDQAVTVLVQIPQIIDFSLVFHRKTTCERKFLWQIFEGVADHDSHALQKSLKNRWPVKYRSDQVMVTEGLA